MTYTLSIVIPAYNESKRLHLAIDALNSLVLPKGLKMSEVIFVNDGSTDNTLKLIKEAKIKFHKSIISYRKNQGKGFAVRKGMLASKADYTLLTDVDIATPLTEINKFMPYIKAELDVIVGTRKNGHSTVVVHQPWLRENMGKVFTQLSRSILGVNVTDFTCGFKLFKREAKNEIFKRAQINKWGYDSEILFLAHKLSYNMIERSVTWSDQKNTKVNLIKDSIRSFLELVQIRINYFTGVYKINFFH